MRRKLFSVFATVGFLLALILALLAPWLDNGHMSVGQRMGIDAVILAFFAGVCALCASDI